MVAFMDMEIKVFLRLSFPQLSFPRLSFPDSFLNVLLLKTWSPADHDGHEEFDPTRCPEQSTGSCLESNRG